MCGRVQQLVRRPTRLFKGLSRLKAKCCLLSSTYRHYCGCYDRDKGR
jgi:hypothetical protein